MIGALKGKFKTNLGESIIFMVDGVGYQVHTPLSLKSKLEKKEKVFLFIYTHTRQDLLELYGFIKKQELFLFKLLIGVSGIGPKIALAIIDRGMEDVQRAVINADTNFFTLIPRLGKKNAQKIIIELKSKLGSIKELHLIGDEKGETKEIVQALISMGFSQKEAYKALRKLPKNLETIEDKIRYALKNTANS